MKIFYIILALLILYSAIALIKFKYTLSKANLVSIIQEEQTFGQGAPLRYIAGGDSTSAGVGASIVENSYPYRIATELSKANTVVYKNVGVSGAKTTDLLENQLNEIIKFNPDIITISIGANDINHQKSIESTLKNIETIITQLTKKTQAKIYLTDIPIIDRASLLPYPYRKLLEFQIKKINPKIHTLESDRVKIIPIHEFGWDSYSDIGATFAKDQFHPNDEGYNNWTKAFLSKILVK